MEFDNRIVVVTGAAGVFGRWITEAFWREGARVVMADARKDAAEAIIAENRIPAEHAMVHQTELTDEASILDLVATVTARWGVPDVVVNNAGIYPAGGLLQIDTAEWDRIFNINVRAPYLVTREFAKAMIAAGRKGAIIMISSGAARALRKGTVPYCTSKTTLERIAKGFAIELAEQGIRVNVVEPGFAPGSVVSPLSPDYVDRMLSRIPLGRSSGPTDAPGAVLYLASERASFITGATLAVDGGNSLGVFEPGPIAGKR
ncbi:MAG: SDR family NAD(P)-dependent oxidoreductase [Hyphomicrobiales bacterium]|nr:SDR family NAD(P)-dependent oxidoreductase [Hyphomicrobiales bacterium]